MTAKREIKRHLLKGVSQDEAARCLQCNKATVAERAARRILSTLAFGNGHDILLNLVT